MIFAEPLQVIQLVVKVFEDLNIRYFLGGSFASSLHGIPRATQDIDVIVDLKIKDIEHLQQFLQGEFYIDQDMIKDAIKRESSFNMIHLSTMFKVDVFILKQDKDSQEEMNRRKVYKLSEESPQNLYMASAEDIIAHKLRWYKLGGEISEKQWKDILGVLQVQGNLLDFSYLHTRTKSFAVEDLLQKIIQEAQLDDETD